MARIRILDEATANQIAAGEVVERPASIVKELIENAIDAGARRIEVRIVQGGRSLLAVEDDGCGIEREDVATAFARHATSKLASAAELLRIATLGFRGEALPSIASVSRLTLTTLARGEREGTAIEIEGGKLVSLEPAAAAPGTVVVVRDLFFNVPARRKFLKSTGAETAAVTATFLSQALAHPEIHFRLLNGEREESVLPRAASRRERAAQLLGADRLSGWIEASAEGAPSNHVRLEALLEPPDRHHATRGEQRVFVNRRPVLDRGLQHALLRAFQGLVPQGRFPAAIVFLEIDGEQVDVNVHPAKSEVRFADAQAVQSLVAHGLRSALAASGYVPALRGAGSGAPLPTGPGGPGSPVGVAGHATEAAAAAAVPGAAGAVLEAAAPYPDPGASAGGARTYHIRPARPAGPASASAPAPGWPGRERAPAGIGESGESRPATVRRASEPVLPGAEQGDLPRVLGQFHQTFVVAADARGLVLFDQHTAHERVLYEQLERGETAPGRAQRLLMPVVVELAPAESALLAGNLDELGRAGVEVDPLGGGAFAVRSLPPSLAPAGAAKLLRACAASLGEDGSAGEAGKPRQRVLATVACHAAVKRNMPLEQPEMERLVADLLRCQDPYRCPHGRAVLLRLDHETIARSFGRYW